MRDAESAGRVTCAGGFCASTYPEEGPRRRRKRPRRLGRGPRVLLEGGRGHARTGQLGIDLVDHLHVPKRARIEGLANVIKGLPGQLVLALPNAEDLGGAVAGQVPHTAESCRVQRILTEGVQLARVLDI